jgi:DNA-binding Lrp family transcriptional regulator
MKLEPFDRSLVAATQAGLPVERHPYDTVGAQLGVSGTVVRERLAGMLAAGLVRRIGAVPNHYRLGFTANGMTVWDVDDAQVDALGMKVGALPFVSHCYRRPRVLPDWRYNLFAMVHGRSRADVERHALEIHCLLAGASQAFDILYSTRILKKTGVRLSSAAVE